jgi:hypothetical protein
MSNFEVIEELLDEGIVVIHTEDDVLEPDCGYYGDMVSVTQHIEKKRPLDEVILSSFNDISEDVYMDKDKLGKFIEELQAIYDYME